MLGEHFVYYEESLERWRDASAHMSSFVDHGGTLVGSATQRHKLQQRCWIHHDRRGIGITSDHRSTGGPRCSHYLKKCFVASFVPWKMMQTICNDLLHRYCLLKWTHP